MPRRSLSLPGFSHANPIPVAAVIDRVLATGMITGRDPGTHEMPPDLATQVHHVFGHVRAVLEAAGGGPEDLLRMTVHLADPTDRVALNEEWTAMFPDPDDRPARMVLPAATGSPTLVFCDLLAVLPG
ncbi:RidA family protein [Nocardioides sp. GY 10127]|uniref:RidA family protein n=1 Tax=Nocardioides sp. GY 10127 TaxID=2569762 RepID=UPI0010A93DC6|nr:RidA family protein [Nocardioides sp. GY 10127]TIC79298.1 RidA family protein [Nocardioides sp. GY 10127]